MPRGSVLQWTAVARIQTVLMALAICAAIFGLVLLVAMKFG